MNTESNKDRLHVMTPIIMAITFGIVTFSTDQPIIILAILFLLTSMFFITGNKDKLSKGLKIFIPFAIVTVIINAIFVNGGSIILFTLFGKTFTLETFIYAFFFSIKLLIIIYIFIMLEVMIDSDKAVSYFSIIIPKTTLSMLISLKLVPSMRERFANLKQIYKIRGVNYEGKSMKERIKSYIPILSVLLEDSLEGSFDIGEAAYVRGFLSRKKTVYEKQKFKLEDYVLIALCLFIFVEYAVFGAGGKFAFDIYSSVTIKQVLNYYVAVFVVSILMVFLCMEYIFN